MRPESSAPEQVTYILGRLADVIFSEAANLGPRSPRTRFYELDVRGAGAVAFANAASGVDEGARLSAKAPTSLLAAIGLPAPRRRRSANGGHWQYRLSVMDARGRLADRAPVRAMGWTPGDWLNGKVGDGFIIIERGEDGTCLVTAQGHLRVLSAIRHSAELSAGERFLVIARRKEGAVILCTMDLVESALAAFMRSDSGGVT